MPARTPILIGAPIDCGKRTTGTAAAPAALRAAGLAAALAAHGHAPRDAGDVAPAPLRPVGAGAAPLHALAETVAWAEALAPAARSAMAAGLPVFLGGDHALALGTLAGAAAHARALRRPLFVLWIDAHADLNTPLTSASGHLHGTPLAHALGRPGFDPFPPLPAPLAPERLCILGLRSVDAPERAYLAESPVAAHDMAALRRDGTLPPLRDFLSRVAAAGGILHVSLDLDALDPEEAPGVSTPVPGGLRLDEAQAIMAEIGRSGLMAALELVELNPALDPSGRSAAALVRLAAAALAEIPADAACA